MKAKLTFKSNDFNRTFAKALAGSKSGKDALAKRTMKGLMREIIDFTPPNNPSKGSSGRDAQKRGQASVAMQIGKLMTGVPAKQSERRDIQAIHKAARSGGRVKGKKRNPLIKVPQRALKTYVKKQQKLVGRLGGGWAKAAAKMGVSIPAYMRNQNSPGSGDIRTSGTGIKILLTNRVTYASGMYNMVRRINAALKSQQKKMASEMKAIAEKAAKRAGLGR